MYHIIRIRINCVNAKRAFECEHYKVVILSSNILYLTVISSQGVNEALKNIPGLIPHDITCYFTFTSVFCFDLIHIHIAYFYSSVLLLLLILYQLGE